MTASEAHAAIVGYALSRGDVDVRRMFGADCFLVGGQMFAFLMKSSLGIKVPPDERARLLAAGRARPFTMANGRVFGGWLEMPLSEPDHLETALGAIGQGYDYARQAPPRTGRERRRQRS